MFMCMRDFGYHIGEETEVYFSLYDAKNFKFIRQVFYICYEHNNLLFYTFI